MTSGSQRPVGKLIDLLKETQSRLTALLADYELAMTKFREGAALISKHVDELRETKSDPLQVSKTTFTPREIEIFALIGQGLTGQKIAEQLKISVKTFQAHRDKIRKKLGMENSYELKRFAKEQFGK